MNNFGRRTLPLLERFAALYDVHVDLLLHSRRAVFDSLCSYLLHSERQSRGYARTPRRGRRVGLANFNGCIRAFWSVQRAVEQQALDRAEKTAFRGECGTVSVRRGAIAKRFSLVAAPTT